MIIDNWATSPGNLNPLRRPEHIGQQTAPSGLAHRNLPGNRLAPGGVTRRLIVLTGMTGFGADLPLIGRSANAQKCPKADAGGSNSAGGAVPLSNTLWAAFDNTKSRLDGRERHVVGHNRLG